MSKAKISVGDDTPTGEPANAPRGPYTTDETDDETRTGRRGPSADKKPGRTETTITQQSELGSDNGGPTRRR